MSEVHLLEVATLGVQGHQLQGHTVQQPRRIPGQVTSLAQIHQEPLHSADLYQLPNKERGRSVVHALKSACPQPPLFCSICLRAQHHDQPMMCEGSLPMTFRLQSTSTTQVRYGHCKAKNPLAADVVTALPKLVVNTATGCMYPFL